MTLETKEINGEEKQCVEDYTPRSLTEHIDVQMKAVNCDVLGLHCLTGSVAWQTVMRKHKWVDRERPSRTIASSPADAYPRFLMEKNTCWARFPPPTAASARGFA